MALKITNREVDGVAVLVLEGRIVLGEETSALREKVKSLIGEGKKNILLNLSNVTLIDSSGLGALVTAYSSAKSGGASLRLCNLGSRSKLSRHFHFGIAAGWKERYTMCSHRRHSAAR